MTYMKPVVSIIDFSDKNVLTGSGEHHWHCKHRLSFLCFFLISRFINDDDYNYRNGDSNGPEKDPF